MLSSTDQAEEEPRRLERPRQAQPRPLARGQVRHVLPLRRPARRARSSRRSARTSANATRDVVLILDAKRGDIGSTAEHYAREAFGRYGADAVTVNPYLGTDAVDAVPRPRRRARAVPHEQPGQRRAAGPRRRRRAAVRPRRATMVADALGGARRVRARRRRHATRSELAVVREHRRRPPDPRARRRRPGRRPRRRRRRPGSTGRAPG